MSPLAPWITLLLFLWLVWYVLDPVLRPEIESLEEEDTRESLEIRKRALYRQIKELDMDWEIGNLTEEDYTQSRLELKQEVADIMQKLKRMR
ncbi:MAG: hypothetical protein D6762_05685 [Candidatus Neomarinimicrobiota bacterium]|nr:MAG: hypothetical protein D6762_05685 [Candidatus Neomarinimicrobiota bacterium]